VTRPELEALVEAWPEWRVKLMDEPPSDEQEGFWAISQVPNPEYHEMVLHFPDNSLTRPEHHIEVTVVHELLHALLRWVGRGMLDEIACYVPPNVHDDAADRAKRHEETFVDRVARSIVAMHHRKPELSAGTRSGNGSNWSHDEPVQVTG
jgi:hypothetical protein